MHFQLNHFDIAENEYYKVWIFGDFHCYQLNLSIKELKLNISTPCFRCAETPFVEAMLVAKEQFEATIPIYYDHEAPEKLEEAIKRPLPF